VSSLQVTDVGEAHPEITKAVETMVSKGKWTVPGMSCSTVGVEFNVYHFCRLQGEVRRLVSYVKSRCYYLTSIDQRAAIFNSCRFYVCLCQFRVQIVHFEWIKTL
jgi:hypothetical protein